MKALGRPVICWPRGLYLPSQYPRAGSIGVLEGIQDTLDEPHRRITETLDERFKE